MEDHSSNTLFVRNLPYSTKSEDLQKLFEADGPVKQCFVVTENAENEDFDTSIHGVTDKCRGFGYVTFALREDATRVLQSKKKFGGRPLHISVAKKKQQNAFSKGRNEKTQKQARDQEQEENKGESHGKELRENPLNSQMRGRRTVFEEEDEDDSGEDTSQMQEGESVVHNKVKEVKTQKEGELTNKATTDENPPSKKKGKKRKRAEDKNISIKGEEFHKQDEDPPVKSSKKKSLKKKKEAVIATDPDEEEKHVNFEDTAEKDRSNQDGSGEGDESQPNKIQHDDYSQDSTGERKFANKKHVNKHSRLIIRNLSFQCKEKDLKEAFSKFGKVTDVVIPLIPNTHLMRGFGFVQFKSWNSAAQAVKQMNAQKLLGRPIAVDWSLQKSAYLRETQGRKQDQEAAGDRVKENKEVNGSREGQDDDDVGASQNLNGKKKNVKGNEKLVNDESDDSGDSDGDGIDGDDDEDSGEGNEDEDMESDDEGEGTEDKMAPPRSSDVEEGRTVFIRNLSYESEEADVQNYFSQFGELKYAKIVMDHYTGNSKGSAFVQFKSKEDADKCLKAAKSETSPLSLHERDLLVTLALQREDANKMASKRKELQRAEMKDKRNLYLLREGLIRPGTKKAVGLTEADLQKRLNIESLKRNKLKDVNVFVSPTRLVAHNLPKSVDDKKLREIFMNAVKEMKGVKITESRIMRNKKSPNSQGKCKSLGFGFVEFTEHKHALEALRQINNSAELFGEDKRPIVGFSLENKKALELKQRRVEKQKMKQNVNTQEEESALSNPGPLQKGKKGSASKTKDYDQEEILSDPRISGPKGMRKGLPSHFGAKMRWRDRGKVIEEARNKRLERRKKMVKRIGGVRESQTKKVLVPKKVQGTSKQGNQGRNKRKDHQQERSFEKLVQSYKNQMTSADFKRKKSKWFE